MTATVADIVKVMEHLAPTDLAEDWDNVGLQVGSFNWPVKKVWVALDPTPDVIQAACDKNVDMLVTHHPMIFKPLKSIDFGTPSGHSIQLAGLHQLAVYTAHTNFDSVRGGLNDILVELIGMENVKPLAVSKQSPRYKLVTYVPIEYEKKFLSALLETEACQMGEYRCCSFRSVARGTFKPGKAAKAIAGKAGEVSAVDEVRFETVIDRESLAGAITHLRSHHPHQVMAYDVYPLFDPEEKQGIGRIGDLLKKTDLNSLAQMIKNKLKLKHVKVVGEHDLPVNKAAVCTGSGSSLLKEFFSSDAQVYISGDLRYHDAKDVQSARRGLIDIGHFASEHIMVEVLAQRLSTQLTRIGLAASVQAYGDEKDPFSLI